MRKTRAGKFRNQTSDSRPYITTLDLLAQLSLAFLAGTQNADFLIIALNFLIPSERYTNKGVSYL